MSEALKRFLEEHRRLVLVVLTVGAADLCLYLLLTGPAQLRLRMLEGDLRNAQEELAESLGAYGRALLEKKLLEHAEAELGQLRSRTLRTDRERFPEVDAKIKELAARFHLDPHAYSFGYASLEKEKLVQLQVSFNLKGSYKNLRDFLSEVEQARGGDNEDMFFAIERVSLADSTDSGTELNLTITVSTYFYAPELGDGSDGKKGPRGGSRRSAG